MNKRRVKLVVLLTGLVGLLLVGAFGLWVSSYQDQEHLNRQLIAALVKRDPQQALVLVNAGADPNTPFKPPSPPSLEKLWKHLIHRTALQRDATPSAFHIACGAYIPNDKLQLPFRNTDEPHLVEVMLQHGARKNAKEGNEWTPLLWSVMIEHPKTVAVLLDHGVDVNAKDKNGYTPLLWALVMTSPADNPPERSKLANLVRQLLAHGADPKMPGLNGITPLQIAHNANCPDLVVLLKQAGAEK